MGGLVGAARSDGRAAAAERSVTALFGGRLLGLPFTHLAHVVHPAPGPVAALRGTWHYWWQAHYLDAVVDAGLRCLRTGDLDGARGRARTGDRLLRTIRLRNRARWTNDFYDDMAWLALASGRLALLHEAIGRTRRGRRLRTAERDLTRQLRSALTDDLGGGLFWSTSRDFKNVPATGPAALHLARLGETDVARRLVDWLYARLWSQESGLFLDGIRIVDGAEHVVGDLWSYNQGTVLGTLVTLGDAESLDRAADLVAAVDDRLTTATPDGIRLLRTHGGGDGGLFTGILARYLALAATTSALPGPARETAARLVRDAAEAFWQGRAGRPHDSHDHTEVDVFSTDPGRPASSTLPIGDRLELSSQLQAWTTFEAASAVATAKATARP